MPKTDDWFVQRFKIKLIPFSCLCFSSLEHFCTDGVGLLKSLIQSRHLKAAVHLLDNILPPTYPLSFYLLNNSQ